MRSVNIFLCDILRTQKYLCKVNESIVVVTRDTHIFMLYRTECLKHSIRIIWKWLVLYRL